MWEICRIAVLSAITLCTLYNELYLDSINSENELKQEFSEILEFCGATHNFRQYNCSSSTEGAWWATSQASHLGSAPSQVQIHQNTALGVFRQVAQDGYGLNRGVGHGKVALEGSHH